MGGAAAPPARPATGPPPVLRAPTANCLSVGAPGGLRVRPADRGCAGRP